MPDRPQTSIPTDTHDVVVTLRQYEVVQLMAQGFSREEVGDQLGMKKSTVSVHVASLYKRAGLADNPSRKAEICRMFDEGKIVKKSALKLVPPAEDLENWLSSAPGTVIFESFMTVGPCNQANKDLRKLVNNWLQTAGPIVVRNAEFTVHGDKSDIVLVYTLTFENP